MDEVVQQRIESLCDVGLAIIVATADKAGVPAITRGWGPLFDTATGRLQLGHACGCMRSPS